MLDFDRVIRNAANVPKGPRGLFGIVKRSLICRHMKIASSSPELSLAFANRAFARAAGSDPIDGNSVWLLRDATENCSCAA